MAGRGRGAARGGRGGGAARGGAAVRGGGRGRGRGGIRGRGRGRGGARGGRGRGRGRGRGQAHQVGATPARALDNFDLPDLQYDEKWDDEVKEEGAPAAPQDLSSQTLKELLLSEAKLGAHMDAIMQEGDLYVEVVHKLVERKMASKWSTPIKGRILAACLAAHRTAAVDYLLKLDGVMGLAEMVKAVQLLDAPRRVRQLEKKLAMLVARAEKDPKSVKSKTIAELKTDIHNASIELAPNYKLSVSGACARRLRKWVETIPASTLEFWLLFFPPEPWKAFADIAHLSPKNFALDYFLPVVYGTEAPAGTLVAAAQKITKYNLEATLKAHPQLAMNYAFVRKKLKDGTVVNAAAEATIKAIMEMGFSKHQAQVALNRSGANVGTQELVEWIVENGAAIERTPLMEEAALMPEGARIFFALHAPLEDVLWNYEEFECKEAEGIVMGRLAKGETLESAKSRLNYGKLMERLLYFRERGIRFAEYLLPYAQDRLKRINVPRVDELKLAVFGDASGSMEVAIKCATTLGSLLSVALNARLSFFNSDSFQPPVIPKTAEDVLKVTETVKADGGTSMASALWPFYAHKVPLDFIIVVSDEGENETSHGHMLAPLFKKYREEVAPRAKLMLVSFVRVGDEGHLKKAFDTVGISVKQVRLDGNRPDTSKFDAVLGLVTLEMTELHERRDLIVTCLQKAGITRDPAGLILQY